jgi:predicted nucleic acid-binding Zn ribbon protein
MSDPLVTETRLNSHEEVCAERYADIKEAFKTVHNRLDKIMYGIVGLLVAMVGWLLVNGVPWKG